MGIDNEMSLSHLAPNTVFEPINEQMHVDGNKGLIYSQLASMLTEEAFVYEPTGKIGYVVNPLRSLFARRADHAMREASANSSRRNPTRFLRRGFEPSITSRLVEYPPPASPAARPG